MDDRSQFLALSTMARAYPHGLADYARDATSAMSAMARAHPRGLADYARDATSAMSAMARAHPHGLADYALRRFAEAPTNRPVTRSVQDSAVAEVEDVVRDRFGQVSARIEAVERLVADVEQEQADRELRRSETVQKRLRYVETHLGLVEDKIASIVRRHEVLAAQHSALVEGVTPILEVLGIDGYFLHFYTEVLTSMEADLEEVKEAKDRLFDALNEAIDEE